MSKKVKEEIVKSYKGFNKDMTCRDFQYKEGESYEEKKAIACETGFHACENPIDCFSYYDPANSIFHEVEQSGKISTHDNDSKIASTKIKIGAKIDIKGFIKIAFEYIKSKTTNEISGENYCSLNGGYRSALNGGDKSALNGGYMSALNGGYRSALNGGDSSALNGGYMSALNGGYMSALNGGYKSALNGGDKSALNGGKYSVCYGQRDAKVKAGLHSILALAEYDDNYNIIKVHAEVVDGKKIKENTFYQLINGKFTEVK